MSYHILNWHCGINHESCSIPKLGAGHSFENVNTHTGWHITNGYFNFCQYCINCISTPAFRREVSTVFPLLFFKYSTWPQCFTWRPSCNFATAIYRKAVPVKWILHQQSPNARKHFSNSTRLEFHRSDRVPENQTVPYKCLAHKEKIPTHMITRPCSAVLRNKEPGFQHISANRSIDMP